MIIQQDRLVPCTFCESSGVEWAMEVTGAQWPQEMDHIMLRSWEDQECSICHGSGYQGIQKIEVMVAFTEDHNDEREDQALRAAHATKNSGPSPWEMGI